MKNPVLYGGGRFAAPVPLFAALLALAVAPNSIGQSAPSTEPASPGKTAVPVATASEAKAPAADDLVVLSPFVITADEDTGYLATSTLGGTRVRTDLRDIAASLSVVTPQFLKNTGATSNETLLQYQTNTEVGGMFGNYAGVGNNQGASEGAFLARPNSNTRVRGLDSADNTRDYFMTDIPWDSYTVDRVDLQRGPNSILFGIGSPAGIINTTSIGARLNKDGGKVEVTAGSYGSLRANIDINKVLIPKILALRVAAVDDNVKYNQDPAYSRNKRIFGAVAYNQQVLPESYAGPLSVRLNGEYGNLRSNRPRSLPPVDKITLFFDPAVFPRTSGRVNLYDPLYSWKYEQQLDRGTKAKLTWPTDPNYRSVPGLGNDMGISGGGPISIYNNGNNQSTYWQTERAAEWFGLNSAGAIDNGIGAWPFGRLQQVNGLNEYSMNVNYINPALFPAAAKAFYKDLSISDPSIFDFYNQLLDGNNKREWNDFKATNLAVAQTFFDNRLGGEFVYDRQDVTIGDTTRFGWNPALSIDVNKYTMETVRSYFPTVTDGYARESTGVGGTLNPNAGRAFIAGSGNGNSTNTLRTGLRFTGFGELRGADFFEKGSFLQRLFSRNVITGIASKDSRKDYIKNWALERTDLPFATKQSAAPSAVQVNGGTRRINNVVYLTGDLTAAVSAAGLGINRVHSYIDPQGSVTGRYFDSHWVPSTVPTDPSYVNPGAPWVAPMTQGALTQSENPANYRGWVTTPLSILSAAHGDINSLYTGASKRSDIINSHGVTLQSYIWDDMIIPTIGWRKDKLKTYGTSGALDPLTNVASTVINNISTSGNTTVKEGETVSWGVVARLPKGMRRTLPFRSDISLFYNRSKNFRAENRVGFDTLDLPNSRGESKDFGIVVSALDDRLVLKVTRYMTKVSDANIPGGNALGANDWYLRGFQAWGALAIQKNRAGLRGELPGQGWFWNYALVDENKWGDPVWENPASPEVVNHPSMIKQAAAMADFIKTMPAQAYFDALGYDVNVAKMASTDWAVNKTAINKGAWDINTGVGDYQPANGGNVRGMSPQGTISQESSGVEIELTANLARGWDLSVNAAKTTASRGDLGASFVNWIEGQRKRLAGPAGDLRLWWGGDKGYRDYYDQFIWEPYMFQKEAKGQMAPEVRPWRFNLITNYSFQEGRFKGVNVGCGYRWQDKVILGYRLNDAKKNLDPKRPIEGAMEDAIDLWIGYSRDLTEKIRWNVQLNLRNLAESRHLLPVSVNPDGTVATRRIVDGMTWSLRSTFEF